MGMSGSDYGRPVERIVVHGSEQTLWEPPVSGGDGEAVLRIVKPLELLGLTEIIHVDFDRFYNIEPEQLGMTESVVFDFDHIHNMKPYGSRTGITETVQIFINDEEAV
jgi:hypothetical protein